MANEPDTTPYLLNSPEHGQVKIQNTSHPVTSPSSTSASPTADVESFPSAFTITPSRSYPTDIWRKPGPPEISTFNAPGIYRKIELRRFISVSVKISAVWTTLYDQGGLIFILPAASSAAGGDGEQVGKKSRWVKTGIEFYKGLPLVGTVARDTWADWSLYPDGVVASTTAEGEQASGVELLIERQEKDDTFWVYVIKNVEGKKVKTPIREVTWVLSDQDVKEVWVGVYAATPTGMEEGDRKAFNVHFEDLKWQFRA